MIQKQSLSSNQSSDKLLKLIEFLAVQSDSLRLTDIANSLNMNSSTTLRFLTALIHNGYVMQEAETSKYYLTYKLCALGQQVKNHRKLPEVLKLHLKEIANTLGETVCLAVNQNHSVVYIDVIETTKQIVKATQRIGAIAPLYCTGIGKLFLSSYTADEIDDVLNKQPLIKFTENTIVTKEALLEELEKVKGLGYAKDNEECEIGTRCLSLPIYDHLGVLKAGFSITGPAGRLTDEFMNEWIKYLRQMSEKLSNDLGFNSLGIV